MKKHTISPERIQKLFKILQMRFEKNMSRHPEIKWDGVQEKLKSNPIKIWSLNEMEETKGDPDVIGFDKNSGQYIFCDCSPESPQDRRSICYDQDALESRKANKPKYSAVEMAKEMGIELMNEAQYQELQKLGEFDKKTSSWLSTPQDIRALGGAIFGDRRFGRVFIYHNGAESYYAGRGFRGLLRV